MVKNVNMHKPVSKKDFSFMAACIREHILDAHSERITFNAGGFKVTCNNTKLAINALAVRIQKGPPCKYKKPVNLGTLATLPMTQKAILKRNSNDPAILSELLNLFDEED